MIWSLCGVFFSALFSRVSSTFSYRVSSRRNLTIYPILWNKTKNILYFPSKSLARRPAEKQVEGKSKTLGTLDSSDFILAERIFLGRIKNHYLVAVVYFLIFLNLSLANTDSWWYTGFDSVFQNDAQAHIILLAEYLCESSSKMKRWFSNTIRTTPPPTF